MLLVDAKQKWQLTKTSFDELLRCLAPDRDEAAEKYLRLRKNLTRFFESRGFTASDDHADEVFNRLAKKLDAGEVFEDIGTYALGIARYLILELRKSPQYKTTDEFPEIAATPFDEEKVVHETNLSCLENCLNKLPPDNRRLIVRYYQGDKREKIENRQRLADDLGIPSNALRNRAVRLRDKLEDCIRGCRKTRE